MSLWHRIWSLIESLPLLEIAILLVLGTLTLFRREWSSNDSYRAKRRDSKPGSDVASDILSMTPEAIGESFKAGIERTFESVMSSCTVDEYEQFEIDIPKSQTDLLSYMADDIVLKFVSYLSPTEINRLGFISKRFSQTIHSDTLWEILWKQRFASTWKSMRIRETRELRRILWDPTSNWGSPAHGWYLFYLQFEWCWMDWLLAGFCTSERCLVGLYGSIYDVTSFLPEHPGSPESLMEFSGGDATDYYEDIGHSTMSRSLAKSYLMWPQVESRTQPRPMSSTSSASSLFAAVSNPSIPSNRLARGREGERPRLTVFQTMMNKKRDSMLSHLRRQNDVLLAQRDTSEISEAISNRLNVLRNQIQSNISSVSAIGATSFHNIQNNLTNMITSTMGTEVRVVDNAEDQDEVDVAQDRNQAGGRVEPANDEHNAQFNVNSSHETILTNSADGDTGLENDRYVRLVPLLRGTYLCRGNCDVTGWGHNGHCRVYFDPLQQEWYCWWSCCGVGRLISEEELIATKSEAEIDLAIIQ